ncbi:MAG: metal ABC transporter substrate-binding protein, partial [Gammaproteobacteria bacterium]
AQGQPGLLAVAEFVPMLEVPVSVDRAGGDIHPYGNPHIQLDPRNIGRVAAALGPRLMEIDPEGREYYRARFEDFQTRWEAAVADWERRGASLSGMGIVVHHRSWVYLQQWLGLEELGSLEPKPGIDPSASHLAELLAGLEGEDLKLIIRSAYQSDRASKWLASRAGVPAVVVPQTVGAVPGADDLFSWFDTILDRLGATGP